MAEQFDFDGLRAYPAEVANSGDGCHEIHGTRVGLEIEILNPGLRMRVCQKDNRCGVIR